MKLLLTVSPRRAGRSGGYHIAGESDSDLAVEIMLTLGIDVTVAGKMVRRDGEEPELFAISADDLLKLFKRFPNRVWIGDPPRPQKVKHDAD